jgi:hypothetical protein
MLVARLLRWAAVSSLLARISCSATEDDIGVVLIPFDQKLEYHFVEGSEVTQVAIWTALPRAIAYALQIDLALVDLLHIKPWDTMSTWQYTTTICILTIPSDQVQPLRTQLRDPSSRLYASPDAAQRELLSLVNRDGLLSLDAMAGSGLQDLAITLNDERRKKKQQ